MELKVVSHFQPTGDQPEAIKALTKGIVDGSRYQTLLGVTGSGKTFTVANVIERIEKPTLILSHNKTLAAQLYGEFKSFFPNNAVEYFVSYYDYYQPEAYLPSTDTYIEKDLSINAELDRLRLRTTASLLSGRRDIVVISSVSCLYGMADPSAFAEKVVHLERGMKLSRHQLLRSLTEAVYTNNTEDFLCGNFRVKGDTVDVFPSIEGFDGVAYHIEFWGDNVERITSFDPMTGQEFGEQMQLQIHPTNLFVTSRERVMSAVQEIYQDLNSQLEFFHQENKIIEAQRLQRRVSYDAEMIRETGYCPGVENYSRYFDGRAAGTRPYCLLDYFPSDFLMVIDESHVTIPQIRAMYGGDQSRKQTLIDYGFRLPAARDNRPLMFDEFETLTSVTIYVSATPADYELNKSGGIVVDQVIRPTGLLDPVIEVRSNLHQLDNLLEEIHARIGVNERVLVTTLTKRMAEELTKFLTEAGVKCNYIHSDVETLERIKIMDALRKGVYDVLIGVNLLREGLDLPEVSLVAVLDADKEGFLRSHRSLTQTAGRAARNINGFVIFYAGHITKSMQLTLDETNRRREKQLAYNAKYGIKPVPIVKNAVSLLGELPSEEVPPIDMDQLTTKPAIIDAIAQARSQLKSAIENVDFVQAANLRNVVVRLHELLEKLP